MPRGLRKTRPIREDRMLRFHSPFDGRRFIGDNRLKIFHDSVYEAPVRASSGCGIDRIPAEEIRIFAPDTAGEAKKRGFVPCPCCGHIDRHLHE